MATTEIIICNSALTKLGARSIQALGDDSNEANACNLRFEACKRAVLRRHPWNFAIDRVISAPEVATPAFEYAYQHVLPANCLRVLSVDPDTIGYRIEGRKILADSNALNVRFIYDCNISLVDELFAEALACYLAWDIAYKITGKLDVQKTLWEMYRVALRDAKSVDAQEERDYELEANMFVESRVANVTPGRSNR